MRPRQKTKVNIGVGIGFGLQLAGLFLSVAGDFRALIGLLLILASVPMMIWGCLNYAEGKGHSKWVGLVGMAGILLGLLTPLPVGANAGPTSTPAHIVAEPTGITNVAITRETLTIDLRPVAEERAAHVEAVYQLYSQGSEQKLDLLFAFGSQANSDLLAVPVGFFTVQMTAVLTARRPQKIS